jgi:hypothetical protein
MDRPPFLIPIFLNQAVYVRVLVDSGYECFSAVSEELAESTGVEFIAIPPWVLNQAAGILKGASISRLVVLAYDIDG